MVLVRRIGYAVLALAAIGVFVFMAPESVDNETQQARVASIESDDDANNESTAGAPQQEVVNGWTGIEYLHLMSDQLNGTTDGRPAALLTLLVLAACLHWGTATPTGVVLQRVAVPRPTEPGGQPNIASAMPPTTTSGAQPTV